MALLTARQAFWLVFGCVFVLLTWYSAPSSRVQLPTPRSLVPIVETNRSEEVRVEPKPLPLAPRPRPSDAPEHPDLVRMKKAMDQVHVPEVLNRAHEIIASQNVSYGPGFFNDNTLYVFSGKASLKKGVVTFMVLHPRRLFTISNKTLQAEVSEQYLWSAPRLWCLFESGNVSKTTQLNAEMGKDAYGEYSRALECPFPTEDQELFLTNEKITVTFVKVENETLEAKLKMEIVREKQLKLGQTWVMCTSPLRNKGKFMREWIEYYRMIGVSQFVVYNNSWTDNTDEVLQPYIDRSIVIVRPWTFPGMIDSFRSFQMEAAQDCINSLVDYTEWNTVMDTDEYIYFDIGDTPFPLLEKKAYGGHAEVCMRSFPFCGNSSMINEDETLLLMRFKYRQPEVASNMYGYRKCFYRTRIANVAAVHYLINVGSGYNKSDFSWERVHVCHYWDSQRNGGHRLALNHCQKLDTTMLERFGPSFKERMQNVEKGFIEDSY